jgi:integrase
MAKRRGRGEGSITQRADGRWMGRVDLGRAEDGRRLRKTVYGATRQEVANQLNPLLGRATTGELLTTSTPTLKTWLEEWFTTHADEWRPSTRRAYRVAIDRWIGPTLASVRLEKLKPDTLQRWINRETLNGARPRVLTAHCVLRSALAWAMTQRVLSYNAAELVKVPRPTRKAIAPLSAEKATNLLTAASGHRLGGMIVVSLAMGLRIGEASGLAWGDVDVDTRALRVRQQIQESKGELSISPLKTANSRRTLTMPAIVVDALKLRRVAQLEERLRAGAEWQNPHDLVFTTPTGRAVSPHHARKALHVLLTVAGLDRMKYHALRHSAATLLLTHGTPLFDVSRVLGHAQISTTSDIYGHLVPEIAAGAAAKMDAVLKARGVS